MLLEGDEKVRFVMITNEGYLPRHLLSPTLWLAHRVMLFIEPVARALTWDERQMRRENRSHLACLHFDLKRVHR